MADAEIAALEKNIADLEVQKKEALRVRLGTADLVQYAKYEYKVFYKQVEKVRAATSGLLKPEGDKEGRPVDDDCAKIKPVPPTAELNPKTSFGTAIILTQDRNIFVRRVVKNIIEMTERATKEFSHLEKVLLLAEEEVPRAEEEAAIARIAVRECKYALEDAKMVLAVAQERRARDFSMEDDDE